MPRWKRAAEMRKRGLKFWQIGERLGISASSAASIITKFEAYELNKRINTK